MQLTDIINIAAMNKKEEPKETITDDLSELIRQLLDTWRKSNKKNRAYCLLLSDEDLERLLAVGTKEKISDLVVGLLLEFSREECDAIVHEVDKARGSWNLSS